MELLRTVLLGMTREERAAFLIRYAIAFGRAFPRQYDEHGYRCPVKRRRAKKKPEPVPDVIGE